MKSNWGHVLIIYKPLNVVNGNKNTSSLITINYDTYSNHIKHITYIIIYNFWTILFYCDIVHKIYYKNIIEINIFF